MNPVEHKVIEIHTVVDITKEFEAKWGYLPCDVMYEVDLTYTVGGETIRRKRTMFRCELDGIRKRGYFMA